MIRSAFRVLQAVIWIALITIAVLLVAGALAPLTLGYRSFVVTSGSMEPTILTGSLVVDEVISPARLLPGDVITYRSTTGEQQLITHRIVGVGERNGISGYITKGDANRTEDPNPVTFNLIVGRYVYSVPFAGYIVVFTNTTVGKLVIVGLAFLLIALHVIYGRLVGDAPVSSQPTRGVSSVEAAAEAASTASRVEPRRPSPESLVLLAQGAARSGNREQAYRHYGQIVEIDPKNEDAWLGMAAAAPTIDDAITCLNAVLIVNPSNDRARQGLAAAERARSRAPRV